MLFIAGIFIYAGAFVYAIYLMFRGFTELDKEMLVMKKALANVQDGSQDFKDTYGQIRGELAKLNTELNKKNAEVDAREQEKDALAVELARLQSQQVNLLAKAADANAKDQEIKRLVVDLERAAQAGRELAQAKVALNTSNLETQECRKKLELSTAEAAQLKNDLQAKVSEISAMERDILALKAEMARAQSQSGSASSGKAEELAARDQEIKRLGAELERAAQAGRELAQMKEALNAENQEAQDYRKKLAQSTDEAGKMRNELQARDQEIKRLGAELERAARAGQELAQAKATLSAGDQQAQEDKKKLAQLTDEAGKLKNDLQARIFELTGRDRDIQTLKDEFEKKNAEASLKEGDLQKLKAELEKKNADVSGKEADLQELRSALERAKGQSAILTVKFEELTAQSQSASSTVKPEELATRDHEIRRLGAELEHAVLDKKKLEQMDEEAAKLKGDLQNKMFELTAREREVMRLKAELEKARSVSGGTAEDPEYEARVVKLKKSEADIIQIEKLLDEEKQSLRAMKMRASEGKMKLQLLNEKTKETVEMIAQFAQGKEFDEFRKSIHMDDTIQKYENEIKDLQIRLLELEKKGTK